MIRLTIYLHNGKELFFDLLEAEPQVREGVMTFVSEVKEGKVGEYPRKVTRMVYPLSSFFSYKTETTTNGKNRWKDQRIKIYKF